MPHQLLKTNKSCYLYSDFHRNKRNCLRRLIFPVLLLPLVYCAAMPISATAQHITDKQDQYISIWGGYSFSSIRLLGKTKHAQSLITGIGFRKKVYTYQNGNRLYYSADLIPFVEFDYPKRDDNDQQHTASGIGISPVGFLLHIPTHKSLNPYIHVMGSVVYIDRKFPTDLSRKLNYSFDLTLGFNLHTFKNGFVSAGYKFHHISNAQTGKENPGLDSNFIFLSISIY